MNCALNLNRTKEQWIDLGVHTEACMTRPDTCSSAGGAISLWVNLVDCPGNSGILSTREAGKTSSAIYCTSSGMRYDVETTIEFFTIHISVRLSDRFKVT